MKTDLLTARILSAYSAKPGQEIDLGLARATNHPEFIDSVAIGFDMLKHKVAPGCKYECQLRCGDQTFPIRLSAHNLVTCSIGFDDGKYFDNFLMTGYLAEVMALSYLNAPVEKLTDHPVLEGSGITITKVTVLANMTIFVTDRTEAENMIEFGPEK
jgi:hypothetical protein